MVAILLADRVFYYISPYCYSKTVTTLELR